MSRRHHTTSAVASSSLGVRDRLVATASELFNREGVRAVGIQRIIEKAGVAKASLYAHFQSKDDLVAACLGAWIAARQAHAEEHLRDSSHDARGKLLALFDLQGEWIRNPSFRGCPLHSVSAEIADPEHPARRVIARHRQWLRVLIATLAAEGKLQPVNEVVGALIVMYDGAFSAALVDGNAAVALQSRWAAERLIDAS